MIHRGILYSDQDGVLTDFLQQAEKVLGYPWGSMGLPQHKCEGQGQLLNLHGASFWADMPPMKDMHVYWEHIKKYNPHILTAYPGWSHSIKDVYDGKWAWVQKHLPGFPQSHFHLVARSDKVLSAMIGSMSNLLIDDQARNIDEFRAAGGRGIQHVSAKVTIIKLKAMGYH